MEDEGKCVHLSYRSLSYQQVSSMPQQGPNSSCPFYPCRGTSLRTEILISSNNFSSRTPLLSYPPLFQVITRNLTTKSQHNAIPPGSSSTGTSLFYTVLAYATSIAYLATSAAVTSVSEVTGSKKSFVDPSQVPLAVAVVLGIAVASVAVMEMLITSAYFKCSRRHEYSTTRQRKVFHTNLSTRRSPVYEFVASQSQEWAQQW